MRAQTRDEALDFAVEVMTEQGVGALTVSEVARRLGMRGPSLYKYFGSLHALYDALFARGLDANAAAVRTAVADAAPGRESIRAAVQAIVRWCVDNPALAQLLYWRVVPGFEPSAGTFAASHDQMHAMHGAFSAAVQRRELSADADSDKALRLLTVVVSGLISQQMANEPGASFEHGRFTTLTDDALDMFFQTYAPKRRRR